MNTIRLGIFVLAGLVLLILAFYLLGKNQSLFHARFEIKAQFSNVSGLVVGNNVRVSGIVVGTVVAVTLVNDTLTEVRLALDKEMGSIVRKNALASIGTDGLIGNRVVNLLPVKGTAALIEPGDVLESQPELNTDAMLRTLDKSNQNVLAISEQLRETLTRINKSAQLATLLDDTALSTDLKASLRNLRQATQEAGALMQDFHGLVSDVQQGKGTVGYLLRDTSIAVHLNEAVAKIQTVEDEAQNLAQELNKLVLSVRTDLNTGEGPAQLVLKDSLASARLQNTLGNLEQGTARFNDNMEALKHNFFFRGYFKKLEKEAKKKQAAGKGQ